LGLEKTNLAIKKGSREWLVSNKITSEENLTSQRFPGHIMGVLVKILTGIGGDNEDERHRDDAIYFDPPYVTRNC
jgi:hypothetical protein